MPWRDEVEQMAVLAQSRRVSVGRGILWVSRLVFGRALLHINTKLFANMSRPQEGWRADHSDFSTAGEGHVLQDRRFRNH